MARQQHEPQHPMQQEASPAPAGISRAAKPWMSRRLVLSKRKRVFRTVMGVLNKLTLENLDVSVEQISKAGIESAEILMGVSFLVYNKAVLEPTSCSMYVEMCAYLSKALPKFPSDGEDDRKPITFGRMLLNCCQQEFEEADDRLAEVQQLTKPEQEVELAEKEKLLQLRTLGNIRFIGELFKQKMISEKIVHYCIQFLLGSDAKTPPAVEKIETLCELLSIVGQQLEERKYPTQELEVYFSRLKEYSAWSSLPSRVQLLILNIIALRANNWVPQQEEVAAKKHLNEIPAEAEENLNLCPIVSSLSRSLPKREDADQARHFNNEEKQIESSHRGGEHTQSLLPGLTEKKMEEEPLGVSSLVYNTAVLEPTSCSMYAERCALSEGLKVFQTVTGILNKLTPENFDVSVEQILNAGIESAEILMGVSSLVYNKAVLEPPISCSMYAVMCVYLSKALPEFLSDDGERITFRRILLTRCQEEFEGADKRLAEIRQLTKPEQEAECAEKEKLLKLCTLGNIKFIGELFKQKMISERLVHSYIRKLLGSDAKSPPAEEKMEALCQLLSSVGKQLEETKYFTKAWEGYFSQLKEYSACSRLPSRVRLPILNIIDLCANNWVPRQEEVAKAKNHPNEVPAKSRESS